MQYKKLKWNTDNELYWIYWISSHSRWSITVTIQSINRFMIMWRLSKLITWSRSYITDIIMYAVNGSATSRINLRYRKPLIDSCKEPGYKSSSSWFKTHVFLTISHSSFHLQILVVNLVCNGNNLVTWRTYIFYYATSLLFIISQNFLI